MTLCAHCGRELLRIEQTFSLHEETGGRATALLLLRQTQRDWPTEPGRGERRALQLPVIEKHRTAQRFDRRQMVQMERGIVQ